MILCDDFWWLKEIRLLKKSTTMVMTKMLFNIEDEDEDEDDEDDGIDDDINDDGDKFRKENVIFLS